MYEIGIIAHFEAAHRLVGAFGPATRLHGHTYRLEVIVRGAVLHEDGTLYDIGRLQSDIQKLVDMLHYQNLDEVPGLAGLNTTAEHVAHFCWDQLVVSLYGHRLHSLLVRVWESPHAYAAYDHEIEH